VLNTQVKTPFLRLQTRLWPFFISLSLLSAAISLVQWFNIYISVNFVLIGLVVVSLLAFIWWRDVIRERLVGYHTSKLEYSFRYGILLFILSEVCFFVSFFWAFYDRSISPCVDLGVSWPPVGVVPLGVYSVPLLNTIILLSSGVRITWSHHSLQNNNYTASFISLLVTVVLGVYFLYIQALEYSEASFTLADGVYGSTFFVSTGFHGFHVMVGSAFLFYVLIRMGRYYLTYGHHFIFEAAAWYWHFVDVVWLFLYINIYWWGSL